MDFSLAPAPGFRRKAKGIPAICSRARPPFRLSAKYLSRGLLVGRGLAHPADQPALRDRRQKTRRDLHLGLPCQCVRRACREVCRCGFLTLSPRKLCGIESRSMPPPRLPLLRRTRSPQEPDWDTSWKLPGNFLETSIIRQSLCSATRRPVYPTGQRTSRQSLECIFY